MLRFEIHEFAVYFQARSIAFTMHRIFSLRLSVNNCLATLNSTSNDQSAKNAKLKSSSLSDETKAVLSKRRLSLCPNVIHIERTRYPNEIRAVTTLDLSSTRRASTSANFKYIT